MSFLVIYNLIIISLSLFVVSHSHSHSFSSADVYLLDDPLSAVDAHVGQHIFSEGIIGALKNKTRVLVTHQVHLLHMCDLVLVLEDGKVKAFGTFEELQQSGIDIEAFVPNTANAEVHYHHHHHHHNNISWPINPFLVNLFLDSFLVDPFLLPSPYHLLLISISSPTMEKRTTVIHVILF